VFKAADTI